MALTRRQSLEHKKNGMAPPFYYISKVAGDVLCILIVGVPLILYKLSATPFHRGFYCDDESIRHPFKEGRVSSFVLYFVGTNLNIAWMVLLEFFRMRRLMLPTRTIGRCKIHPLAWELYRVLGVFGFGCCVSQLTTDIAKYMLGRLRPHFLSVCFKDPNILIDLCSKTTNFHRYIDEYVCDGDQSQIREARLSFPSGHSSFSAFTMVYLVLYIQARMPSLKRFTLVKPLVQFGCLVLALTCGLSRISDYKHHWSDVLGGFTQGTLVALIIVFFVSDLYKTQSPDEETLPITQQDRIDDVRMYSSTTSTGSNKNNGDGGKDFVP